MTMPVPPLAQIPASIAALADYEPYARERMSEAAWAYFDGGAADEHTLRDNLAAYARLRLNSRVLASMAGAHTRLQLFGDTLDFPVLVAPMAYQRLAHPQGEHAMVLGATAIRAGLVVSTQASITLEEAAQTARDAQPDAAARPPLWFQLYLQADRAFTRLLVQRAEAAGYRALVLTVDAPVNALRNREQRAGFMLPAGIDAASLRGMRAAPNHTAHAGQSPVFSSPQLATAASWDDIAWLQSITPLPLLLKGVMSAEDAVHAVDLGASGLVVSNHGGRTLDTLPATLDALPAIAAAVNGRVPLLLDGGIRRGTDVLKAIALGASAVLVGRPCLHALAAAGASGVVHVMHLLRAELELAMVMTGRRTLAEIDASVIWSP